MKMSLLAIPIVLIVCAVAFQDYSADASTDEFNAAVSELLTPPPEPSKEWADVEGQSAIVEVEFNEVAGQPARVIGQSTERASGKFFDTWLAHDRTQTPQPQPKAAAPGAGQITEPPRISPFDQAFSFYSSSETDKHSAEIRRLDRDVARLAGILSSESDAAKKSDVESKIEALLGKQFDLRQQSREEELKGLEERVRKLRENFEKRQNARAEIVKHRLEEIKRDAEGLGWGENKAGDVSVSGAVNSAFSGSAILTSPAAQAVNSLPGKSSPAATSPPVGRQPVSN